MAAPVAATAPVEQGPEPVPDPGATEVLAEPATVAHAAPARPPAGDTDRAPTRVLPARTPAGRGPALWIGAAVVGLAVVIGLFVALAAPRTVPAPTAAAPQPPTDLATLRSRLLTPTEVGPGFVARE